MPSIPQTSEHISSCCKKTSEPMREKGHQYNIPYLFSIPNHINTDESLKSALKLPHSTFIEITSKGNELLEPVQNVPDNSPNLTLSITTASCYKSSIAHILTESINTRFSLSGDKDMQISTCLHEAIMNAMIHGNLGLQSNFCTLDGLCAYQAEIGQRLNNDMYQSRYVHISFWNTEKCLQISVSDEGEGFDMPDFTTQNEFPRGRGLMFIHSLADKVWLDKDRRTLFMIFNHHQ